MTDGRASGNGPKVAVALVVALGLLALYVALGGPIPFVPEGGPALESVPSESDVVVYADTWTVSDETSQDVADGLLTASNESLPGYSGPASLGAGFSTLGNTSLDPERLRSVTAFGSYGEEGRVGTYQGMILKTTWSRSEMLTALGGDADAFGSHSHEGTTVFVDPDRSGIDAAVAELEDDLFVIGSPTAVRDAIDAHDDRDEGVNPVLERRFRDLRRGPVKFAASVPDGAEDPFVPERIAQTITDVETISGVYYPDGDDVSIELVVGARSSDAAARLEPETRQALAEARAVLPDRADPLLRNASVTRSGTSVQVSMTGPAEDFVDGYEALLDSGLVNFLLGEPVGEPALQFVPGNATTVGYADAGLVVDVTTRRVFEGVLADQGDEASVDRVFTGLDTVSAADLISLRSVTVFSGGGGRDEGPAIAAIVQARWDRVAIEHALEAADASYYSESRAGRTVLVVTGGGQPVWIAPLGENHLVVGTAPAVRDAIAVSDGDGPSLSGSVEDAMTALPRSYVRVATTLPDSVADVAGPLSGVVNDIEAIGASYDAGERIEGQLDLHFESSDRAREAAGVITFVRQFGGDNIDNERIQRLLDELDVSRDGEVVTLSAETDPETILALLDQLPLSLVAT